MDGEDGDEELLTGAGSWTRPQKRQRAELQAERPTHPGPSADAPGACDEAAEFPGCGIGRLWYVVGNLRPWIDKSVY